MNEQSEDLKARLLRTDQEYQRLDIQHHELEGRLAALTAKPRLSEPELAEEVILKKRKLQVKDQMARILRQHDPGPRH